LWSFDPAGGEERVIGPPPMPPDHEPKPQNGCDVSAKAGSLEACGKAEDLSVSRDNKAIGHFKTDECPIDDHGTLGKCETPIVSLQWSPDAKWLLVETAEDAHEVRLLRRQSHRNEAHQGCHCGPRSLAARTR